MPRKRNQGKKDSNMCNVCLNVIEIFNHDRKFSLEYHNQQEYHLSAPKIRTCFTDTQHSNGDVIYWYKHYKSTKNIENTENFLMNAADGQYLNAERNETVRKDVEEVFSAALQCKIKATLFGSRVTNLQTKTSGDLDIFVDVPITNREDYEQKLRLTEEYIIVCQNNAWVNLRAITDARTPILRAVHVGKDMQCDISMHSKLSLSNTELVKAYIRNAPQIRGAILLLREWLRLCEFSEITNYCMSLMALFHFQCRKYIPSVQVLNKLCPVLTTDISGYTLYDYEYAKFDVSDDMKNKNPKELLQEFFEFYGSFVFERDAVCPLEGKPVRCSQLNSIPKSWGMIIQDPIDLQHNLTKTASNKFAVHFCKTCLNCSCALSLLK